MERDTADAETHDASEELPIDRLSHATVHARFAQLLRGVTPHLWIVPAIVFLNVFVYVAMLTWGGDAFAPRPSGIVAWGANYRPRTLGGQPWRLLTSVFVHTGAIHLAVNMGALWSAGAVVERAFGRARFAAIYFAAGLCGSVASVAVHPLQASAGASGAVFGVYGALGAFLLRQRGVIPPRVLASQGGVALGFVAFNLLFGLFDPRIDVAAHAGGLLAGAAAGAVLARPLEPGRPERRGPPALVAALAVALAAAAYLAIPQPPDLRAVLQRFAEDDARTTRTYRAILARGAHPTTSADETAALIEERVIAPWRATRARLAEPREWTTLERQLLDVVIRYVDAREESWERRVQALRSDGRAALAESPDDDAAATLLEELKQLTGRDARRRP